MRIQSGYRYTLPDEILAVARECLREPRPYVVIWDRTNNTIYEGVKVSAISTTAEGDESAVVHVDQLDHGWGRHFRSFQVTDIRHLQVFK